MKYKCLKKNFYELDSYTLVPYRHEDLTKIMQWRNVQIDVLRQKKPLTEEDQKRYFKNVIRPTFESREPPIMLFSFLKDDICIGYGGLVYINWEARRAEVSFLVDPKRAKDKQVYEQDFSHYLTLLKQIAFDDLKLNRIYAETYAIRKSHLEVLEKNGFKYEGRMCEHAKIKGRIVDSFIHAVLRRNYV